MDYIKKSNFKIHNLKKSQRKNAQSRMTEGRRGKGIRPHYEGMIHATNGTDVYAKRFEASD
jgi:hypothetical protein